MAKQKKQLIVLCVVAVLMLALWFLLRALNEKRAAEADARTDGDYFVTDIEGEIDALTVEGESGALHFVLKDGVWVETSDEDASLVQSKIEAMVSKGRDLPGIDRIEGVTDFDQYGLADPRMRVTFSAGGADTVICIGDTNTAVNRTYVRVEGEDTVYTTGTSVVTQYDVTLDDLMEDIG